MSARGRCSAHVASGGQCRFQASYSAPQDGAALCTAHAATAGIEEARQEQHQRLAGGKKSKRPRRPRDPREEQVAELRRLAAKFERRGEYQLVARAMEQITALMPPADPNAPAAGQPADPLKQVDLTALSDEQFQALVRLRDAMKVGPSGGLELLSDEERAVMIRVSQKLGRNILNALPSSSIGAAESSARLLAMVRNLADRGKPEPPTPDCELTAVNGDCDLPPPEPTPAQLRASALAALTSPNGAYQHVASEEADE